MSTQQSNGESYSVVVNKQRGGSVCESNTGIIPLCESNNEK